MLFLLIAIQAIAQTASPFPPGDSYSAGYINLTRVNAQLFYWLQFARHNATSTPLILWLQGGPGCSSVNDQFTDIGAFNIYPNGTIYNNPYAWNSFANLLFVDQPLGTGLSFCSDISLSPNNEIDISNDLYAVIKGVMNMFPSLKGSPLYISGHSYGGHYVPSSAQYFMQKHDPDVNVVGISIGDGWFTSVLQAPAYSAFSSAKKLATPFQVTTSSLSFKLSNMYQLMKPLFSVVKNYFIIGNIILTGLNPRFCVYEYPDAVCPDDGKSTQMMNFLATPAGKAALNVTSNVTYQICNGPVYNNMMHDYMNTSVPALEYVLSKKIKTIIYVGQRDWICNEFGQDDVLKSLSWEFADDFNNAEFTPYYVAGSLKGSQKSFGYMSYFKLTNCGHGVEQDDQVAAFDLMERLIN